MSQTVKTILITGANAGLGYHTALSLAAKKHKIIMVDKSDMSVSKQVIIDTTKNDNIRVKTVDFTSLEQVRALATDIKNEEAKLDVLINNVGVFCLGKGRTEDGLQATMQVNHFAPFLLTSLLSEIMVKSSPSRIIFLSSLGAFFNNLTIAKLNNPEVCPVGALSSLLNYYNSKLCNMIIANGFSERLSKLGVMVNSVHPGMSSTEFLFKNPPCFLQDPSIGAENVVQLSIAPRLTTTGQFFVNFRPHQQPNVTQIEGFCKKLWECTEYFVK